MKSVFWQRDPKLNEIKDMIAQTIQGNPHLLIRTSENMRNTKHMCQTHRASHPSVHSLPWVALDTNEFRSNKSSELCSKHAGCGGGL